MPHRPSRRTIALFFVPLLVLVPLLGSFAQADGGSPRDPLHGEPRFLDVPRPGTGDVTVRLAVPWQPSASAPSGAAALGYTGVVLMPLPALIPSTGLADMVKGVSRCAGFPPAAAAAGCAALTRAASCAGLSATSYCVMEDQPFAGAIQIGVAHGHTPLLLILNVQAQAAAGVLADAVGVAYTNPAWAAGSFAPTVPVDLVTALPVVAKIVLRTAAANGGSEVTRLSTTTDPLHTLYAAGYDADGAYLGDQASATWSVSDSELVALSATSGASVTLDPRKPGVGTLEVVVDGARATVAVDVTAGAFKVLRLSGEPDGGTPVTAVSGTTDSRVELHASAEDADGNRLSNAGEVVWSLADADVGRLVPGRGPSTVLDATAAGTTTLTASASGISVQIPVTISNGALFSAAVRNAANGGGESVSRLATTTDPLHTLYAAGYDADGGFIGDQTTATWEVSDPEVVKLSATSGASVTLDPRKPGTATLTVTIGDVRATSVLDVASGAASRLIVRDAAHGAGSEVSTLDMRAGDATQLFAAGYDTDGNFVDDLPATWAVVPADTPCGDVMGTPTPALFKATRAGIAGCRVTAAAGDLTAQTGVVTVLPGEGLLMSIFDDAGEPVGDISLSTSDELRLHAFRQDAEGNHVHVQGDVYWGVAGGCGSLNVTQGASVTFDPTRVTTSGPTDAQCRVYASTVELPAGASPAARGAVSAGEAAWTGVLTVTPGPVTIVKVRSAADGLGIEVGSPSLTTDQLTPLFAAGYDADLNFVADQATASWIVSDGAVATLSATTGASVTLDPRKPGSTVVTATVGDTFDSTGAISVSPGRFAVLLVRDAPGNAGAAVGQISLDTGETLRVHAAGYDADMNYLDDIASEWTVLNGCGDVVGDGSSAVFTAGMVSHPDCRIQAAAHDIVGTSGRIVLGNTPPVTSLVVRNETGVAIGDFSRVAGIPLRVVAAGYSADGAFLGNQSTAAWTTKNAAGVSCGSFSTDLAGDTFFLPTTTGITGCRVRAALNDVSGETGNVTVHPGNTASITVTGIPAVHVAGSAFPSLDIVVYDEFGNVNTSFAAWGGKVRFEYGNPARVATAGPTQETIPADQAFTAAEQGRKTVAGTAFDIKKTASVRYLNVTAMSNTTVLASTKVVTTFEVVPGPLHGFAIDIPAGANVVAGNPYAGTVTVTLQDAALNTLDSYEGTIEFGTTDARGSTPADVTLTAGDTTVLTFEPGSFTFVTATGAAKISATSGSVTSQSTANIVVYPAPAEKLVLTLPGETYDPTTGTNTGTPTLPMAGATFTAQLRAVDEFGNVLNGAGAAPHKYSGTKSLVFGGPSGWEGTKPTAKGSAAIQEQPQPFGAATPTSFSSGTGVASVQFKLIRDGAYAITVGDGALTGTSSTLTVKAADAYRIVILRDGCSTMTDRSCIVGSAAVTAAWKPKVGEEQRLVAVLADQWDNLKSTSVGQWSAPQVSPPIASVSEKVLWTPASTAAGKLTLGKEGLVPTTIDVAPVN